MRDMGATTRAVLEATGFTGREIVFQALLTGHTVYALARDTSQIIPSLPGTLSSEQEKRLHLV
jgi:hypothetical protein